MNSSDINYISSKASFFRFNFKEYWEYKDLLLLFVRREIVVKYKQTIFGPLWYFIQPLLQTIIFTIVFGNIAKISTDGVPKILFYLSGVTLWNYFADSLKMTSDTFVKNYSLFNKIYFPRAIIPFSIVLSNLLKFIIQFFLLILFYIYFLKNHSLDIPNKMIFILPILIFVTAGLSFGFGLIISSLTTKYRDLNFLIQFGVQLWMYATPVIYPLSQISNEKKFLVFLNPMTSIVETFKYSLLNSGTFSLFWLIYSFIFMIIILIIGFITFHKMERNFVDTA